MTIWSDRAWIGIGANLGEPQDQVLQAINRLEQEAELTVEACSSLYQTEPVGQLDQPDFINAVVRIEVALEPFALLRRLLMIESEFGRIRNRLRNGPRVLDLDLLMFEDRIIDTEELVLPHPRMHQRLFVLRPLLEMEGEIQIAGIGSVVSSIERCGNQRIIRLTSVKSELGASG